MKGTWKRPITQTGDEANYILELAFIFKDS